MQNANTNKIGFRVAENLLCPAVGSSVQERDLEQVQQRVESDRGLEHLI